jgi:hypothetical protein
VRPSRRRDIDDLNIIAREQLVVIGDRFLEAIGFLGGFGSLLLQVGDADKPREVR